MNGDAMSTNGICHRRLAQQAGYLYSNVPLLYYMERVKKIILLPVTTTLEAYFCDSATSFIDCMSIAK